MSDDVQARLTVLEEKMIAAARLAQSEEDLLAARQSLDRYLRPYRGKMTADQLSMLEKQFLERSLLERAKLPRYLASKISPHQVDLRDVLGLAELRGTLPDDTVAVGLQPQNIALGDGLSPVLAGALDAVTATVLEELASRGYPAEGLIAESLHA